MYWNSRNVDVGISATIFLLPIFLFLTITSKLTWIFKSKPNHRHQLYTFLSRVFYPVNPFKLTHSHTCNEFRSFALSHLTEFHYNMQNAAIGRCITLLHHAVIYWFTFLLRFNYELSFSPELVKIQRVVPTEILLVCGCVSFCQENDENLKDLLSVWLMIGVISDVHFFRLWQQWFPIWI